MFLTRLRRKESFQYLGYLFGCGEQTCRDYHQELVDLFVKHVVPNLVYPFPPSFLMRMKQESAAKEFPDLLYVLDGTSLKQNVPGNFLENRLCYSAYKHEVAFQVLVGI